MVRREPFEKHLPRRHPDLLNHTLLQPPKAGGDVVRTEVVGDDVVVCDERGVAFRAGKLEFVHVDWRDVAAGLDGGDGAVIGVEDDCNSLAYFPSSLSIEKMEDTPACPTPKPFC